MAYNHEYPYVDPNRYNSDWILNKIKELMNEMNTFVALNKITFSGEWDITKQYPAWTIVNTNGGRDGYISIRPVPAGVTIDNTDYWVSVANYSDLIADLQNRVVALEGRVDVIEPEVQRMTPIVDKLNTFVTPQQFGAVADGVEDDTQAIQDAMDYAFANGKNLYFPRGTYAISAPITHIEGTAVDGSIEIFGESTREYYSHVAGSIIVAHANYADNNSHGFFYFEKYKGIRIHNLAFKSDRLYLQTPAVYVNGLTLNDCGISEVAELDVEGFNYGIYLNHTGASVIRDNDVTRCLFGIRCHYSGDNDFRGNYLNTNADAVNANDGVGLFLDSCGQSNVYGGKFEYNNIGIWAVSNSELNVSDVVFDYNTRCHMDVRLAGQRVNISNVFMKAGGFEGQECAIFAYQPKSLCISNLTMIAESRHGNTGPVKGIYYTSDASSGNPRHLMLSNVLCVDGLTRGLEVGGGNSDTHIWTANCVLNTVSVGSSDYQHFPS